MYFKKLVNYEMLTITCIFRFQNCDVSLLFPLTCTFTCGTIMPENNKWSWHCFITHLFTLCAQFGFSLVCNGKASRAVNRGQALWAGEEGVQYWPLLVATVHCSLQVRSPGICTGSLHTQTHTKPIEFHGLTIKILKERLSLGIYLILLGTHMTLVKFV